ncbi:hypothetical protein Tco_1172433 [Tanacetum coccineum]
MIQKDLFVWPRVVQTVNAVCPQTPQRVVTCSSPKKRVVKPSSYLTSPYMNKKTKVIPLLKRLVFVLGNSLFAMQGDKFEIVFQTRSGHELSSVRLNMETLAPNLWIDANVVDCWVAILNHEELTQAMIEGSINEKDQWKVFSTEISAQFRHEVSSISLFEVDLGAATRVNLEEPHDIMKNSKGAIEGLQCETSTRASSNPSYGFGDSAIACDGAGMQQSEASN